MPPTPTPHDALFKAAFGRADLARAQLEQMLPAAVLAQLDLRTLQVRAGSFVDEELRASHADLLYAVQTRGGGEALVYVLFEHQSSFDGQMPWRLLKYVVRLWEERRRDKPNEARLPVVIPVVLHHGSARWEAAPAFETMLDGTPELLEAVRPLVPGFRFLLDDLAAASLEELWSRAQSALARLVLMALWSRRSLERLQQAAPAMARLVASSGRDESTRELLVQLYVYLFQAVSPELELDEVRTILMEVAGSQGQEDVVNAGEKLIEQGRVEGLEKGFQKGRIEGRVEGRVEGLRAAIVTTLAARSVPLGPAARVRLEACADVDVLTRWLTRALAAVSDADLFALDDG